MDLPSPHAPYIPNFVICSWETLSSESGNHVAYVLTSNNIDSNAVGISIQFL